GGGVLITGANVLLTDVIVRDCFGRYGGGIAALHDQSTTGTYLTMKWSSIRDNLAETAGGGIFAQTDTKGRIDNCVIRQNGADGDGGGIMIEEDVVDYVMSNCSIFDNVAQNQGGGVYVGGATSGVVSALAFVNLTVAYNTANTGSGVYLSGAALGGTVARKVVSTILYKNPAGQNDDNIVIANGIATFEGQNSFVGLRVNTVQAFTAGNGSFIDAGTTLNPGWVNPAARNFRLKFTSICIDQGNDEELFPDQTDLDDDINVNEPVSRDLYHPDLALIPFNLTTREVSVPGAGTTPVGGSIGVDDALHLGVICDIGAFEHRIVDILPQ
ncbi:MAG: hypothetical protein DRJ50_09825, partial [Actinobacteria bacterium]